MSDKSKSSHFALLILVAGTLTGCSAIPAKPDASMGDAPSNGPVGRTMNTHSEKFVSCARDAVSVQTGSTQHIQLRFVVDPDGSVKRATIDSMTAPDPDLHNCLLHQLRKVKFPPPADGKSKTITYPLVLKPE